jgi:HSP20 family protein
MHDPSRVRTDEVSHAATEKEEAMAMTRYTHANPWRELDQLSNRFSRLFDGANGGMPMSTPNGTWAPAVGVEETQEELVLTAELPGLKPADVEIQLENNVLTVRGEKREERREEERRYHLWERGHGSFQLAFTLPHTVRADDISAEFEDGLLRVRMPKVPEARSRRIEIRGAGGQPVAGEVGGPGEAGSRHER